jgi:hypothetical protein
MVEASARTHTEAIKELLFVWTLSLLPILLTSFIEAAKNVVESSGADVGLWDALYRNVKTGEIFIYVNALLAPIGYVVCKHIRDEAKLPNFVAFVWLLCIAVPLSTTIFALQRTGAVHNQRLIDRTAFTIFVVAFLMRYTSLVYDSFRVDFIRKQKAQEDDLIDEMRRRTGNGK